MVTFSHEENENKGRFTLIVNSKEAGQMTYVWAGKDKFIIDHTETYEGYSGKGYGKLLVKKGVEYARERGVKVIPLCPVAKKVISGSPDLSDVLFK